MRRSHGIGHAPVNQLNCHEAMSKTAAMMEAGMPTIERDGWKLYTMLPMAVYTNALTPDLPVSASWSSLFCFGAKLTNRGQQDQDEESEMQSSTLLAPRA